MTVGELIEKLKEFKEDAEISNHIYPEYDEESDLVYL